MEVLQFMSYFTYTLVEVYLCCYATVKFTHPCDLNKFAFYYCHKKISFKMTHMLMYILNWPVLLYSIWWQVRWDYMNLAIALYYVRYDETSKVHYCWLWKKSAWDRSERVTNWIWKPLILEVMCIHRKLFYT